MNLKQKEEVALFRFGVISDLVGGIRLEAGDFEKLLARKAQQKYSIPYSAKTSISVSTIRRWVWAYLKSNRNFKSLQPKDRKDSGDIRCMDSETASILLNLKKEMPNAPLKVLIKTLKKRNPTEAALSLSESTLYRFFKQNEARQGHLKPKTDRRRFEAETTNDIWQSDVMHGPKVEVEGKSRKTYLIAFIDDHSRLITHAQFYLAENLQTYLNALQQALSLKGIPRKLYVDNGSAFRSKQLELICASLGISLVHSEPYIPEGRGKIERFFKTVRSSYLSMFKEGNLEALNLGFSLWLDEDYQNQKHQATSQTPQKRFMTHLELLRSAPHDLHDYFRHRVKRKVSKDRIVSLNRLAFEAPAMLIGEQVDVWFHPEEPQKAEVFFKNRSYGPLRPLDLNVNCRVSRDNTGLRLESTFTKAESGQLSFYQEDVQ